jgi:prepilin-type processing-associated H-X9-DG protein
LIPSLQVARDGAKRVICASNLRQVYQAGSIYSQENEDRLLSANNYIPPGGHGSIVGPVARKWWFEYLMPYLGSVKNTEQIRIKGADGLWICPADRDPFPIGAMPQIDDNPIKPATSYALNGCVMADSSGKLQRLGAASGLKVFEIPSPASVMYFMETSYWYRIVDGEHEAASMLGFNLSSREHHRISSGFYHLGSMNTTFVDGHIESVKGREAPAFRPRLIPGAVSREGHMFWENLSLPDARENPGLWGPGYTKTRAD